MLQVFIHLQTHGEQVVLRKHVKYHEYLINAVKLINRCYF